VMGHAGDSSVSVDQLTRGASLREVADKVGMTHGVFARFSASLLIAS
jgi:hypothetical protein